MSRKFLAAAFVWVWSSSVLAMVYEVDPVHSMVLYRIKHQGVSENWGRFNDKTGTIVFDAKDISKGSVEFTVKAESIDTAVQKRDDHLRGPDFFNVKQFPVITFKSKKISAAKGKDSYNVEGDLNIHGVTKPIKLAVRKTGEGKDQKGNALIGFATEVQLKRTDFGLNFMVGPISDELNVVITLEAVEKK